MASHIIISMVALTPILLMLMAIQTSGQSVGVCYGLKGDNLPPPNEVVDLYKSKNIARMRLYAPDKGVLQALKGSNIQVVVDVTNGALQTLATDPAAAAGWVQDNVRAFWPDVAFRYIVVGNEVIPGVQAQYVLPAMQNIHSALVAGGLQDKIKVSVAVHMAALKASFPPSAGEFPSEAAGTMGQIAQFLASTGAPLLANVYPYLAYAANQGSIAFDYVTFTASGSVVRDGPLGYQNLFDAMVDALYSALEKVGGSQVEIAVSETGWPSDGGFAASPKNAMTYNANLIQHVIQNGTPKRPSSRMEINLFAMFNEDQKLPPGTENHYGLYYPNKTAVYPLFG